MQAQALLEADAHLVTERKTHYIGFRLSPREYAMLSEVKKRLYRPSVSDAVRLCISLAYGLLVKGANASSPAQVVRIDAPLTIVVGGENAEKLKKRLKELEEENERLRKRVRELEGELEEARRLRSMLEEARGLLRRVYEKLDNILWLIERRNVSEKTRLARVYERVQEVMELVLRFIRATEGEQP